MREQMTVLIRGYYFCCHCYKKMNKTVIALSTSHLYHLTHREVVEGLNGGSLCDYSCLMGKEKIRMEYGVQQLTRKYKQTVSFKSVGALKHHHHFLRSRHR